MSILRKIAVFAFAALFAVVFSGVSGDSALKAEKNDVWITIEASEMEQVLSSGERALKGLRMTRLDERNGIAVVKTRVNDLEILSSLMHKHHHKCGGFMAHDTFNEALRSALLASPESSVGQVTYTIDNQSTATAMVAATEEMPIRQMILDLSSYETRRHNSDDGQLSANYINFRWSTLAAGREDISVSFYEHPQATTPQPSVILTIEGTESPDELVILGGHQDSINRFGSTLAAPGADDNASGIASLTEAIRVIVESGFRPKKTVQFMAYAAEEVGLRGSQDIAQNYLAENRNVVGVLQLDMTNFTADPGTDFVFITDFTNSEQNQFLKDLVDEYLPGSIYDEDTCNYGCSDHASWHREGFVASFPHEGIITPDPEIPGQIRTSNPEIHTVDDTIELSENHAENSVPFVKLALAYTAELAKGVLTTQSGARAVFDFDGDSKTDVSVFRPNASGLAGAEGSASQWWILNSSDQGTRGMAFGNSDDIPVVADYTGDGKADVAFFRPASSEWFVLRSEDDSFFAFPFGTAGDVPAPGDFDGDGTADPAVFRPGSGTWFILRSSDSQLQVIPFGVAGDQPTVADFDGDGLDDVAIYRSSENQFWQLRSTDGAIGYQFGSAGDRTAIGDWTGDGKADVAFFRPSDSSWYVVRSEDSSFFAFPWGASGDVPSPGDYDGDGSTDPAVWRPSDKTWYILGSTSGFQAVEFGANGDTPLPSSISVQ
ncbi:MAG: M20/M25/M40 family metallo-hydrolase [Acidobacteria bacterium]|nr:MAG: M20/M25/M40 family metallo-hydrolase [Acidobacteriota bacterium]REK01325.1 MAG: M20/M25/M40 family metallo-hydrolase [Acidobacteriota bacterium]REK14281.1 MAG: M20/M25/M40 family metallo-hydrolase [Acidobacteriota bacterium]REK44996.1 MAG: M20/M25/M40 family metallo-hydrolase [Acidobacteriota bacterium]